MLQLEKCKSAVLKVQTTELWEVEGINMPTLQVFVSMYPTLFNEFVIIDETIMDDVFKKLDDINAILIKRDN